MPKVKTESFSFDGSISKELQFKTDIFVDKEGTFSTTLPKDIVELFKEANIDLSTNRMGNAGYLSDTKYDGLIKQISDIGKEYLSRTLTSEKIVLSYIIQTACSYCIDDNKNIVPNGAYIKDFVKGWKGGTLETNATNHHAYGLQVYIRPCVRKDYLYKSGKTKIEYETISKAFNYSDDVFKDKPNLKWLNCLIGMDIPSGNYNSETKEIEYTEATAGFFVNMITSICMMNERIKDFLEPEAILKIANSGFKLLGGETENK